MALEDLSQAIQKHEYHTFLLRLWRDDGGQWRIMLQHARTRVSYGFQTMAEALAFVEAFCIDGAES